MTCTYSEIQDLKRRFLRLLFTSLTVLVSSQTLSAQTKSPGKAYEQLKSICEKFVTYKEPTTALKCQTFAIANSDVYLEERALKFCDKLAFSHREFNNGYKCITETILNKTFRLDIGMCEGLLAQREYTSSMKCLEELGSSYSGSLGTSTSTAYNLESSYQQSAGLLINLYKASLESIKEFKEWAPKQDIEKFQSYVETLERALQSVVNDKGESKFPVTHWMMIENARLVLGLSELVSQAVTPYLETKRVAENLAPHVEVIKTLGQQIRKAYGWNSGLVGGGSKAVSTLGMIIRTVLVDLEQNSQVKASQDGQSLLRLRQLSEQVIFTGEAHEGGDAFVSRSRSLEEFVSIWNSANTQGALARLSTMSEADQATVTSKIQLLLMSITGLKTLTGLSMEIPNLAIAAPVIAKAPAQQPVTTPKKK